MAETIIVHRGLTRPVEKNQIERYMGMGGVSLEGEILKLYERCRPLVLDAVSAKACYLEVPVSINNYYVDFEYFGVESKNLSAVLRGCKKAVLIAATLGASVDMIIRREAVISKASALVMNSVASAAIESYITQVNEAIKADYPGMYLRPRYSPGYGDVPLEVQRKLLSVLDTNRKIGVALSESLLMTPEKSVSAFIGIAEDGCIHIDKDCDICSKKDCEYRLAN